MAISRNGLLITDKILDSGHGAEILQFSFLYSRSPTLTSKCWFQEKLSFKCSITESIPFL
mgnify:CR=1 FL=1